MDEEIARRAAELYGRISELRAEAASAVPAGDRARVAAILDQAFDLSTDMLRGLAGVRGVEALPYRLLAFAVRDDIALARASAGNLSSFAQVFTDLDEVWSAANQDVAQVISGLVDRFLGPDVSLALRACPHGRPSYDGHCLARPPCPAS